MKKQIKRLLIKACNLERPSIVNVKNVSLSTNQILEGRRALITGGTSGIGKAIALAFLKAGCSVAITGRDLKRVQETIQEFKDANSLFSQHIYGLKWDVQHDDISIKYDELKNILGGNIDILVNNAGIDSGAMAPNTKSEDFDKVIDTNLKGSYFLSQYIGRIFTQNKICGNILFISSSSAIRPAISPYMLSKWGIRGLTLGFAKSLAPYGITVNGIAPGPTATPMLLKEGASLAHKSSPLKRFILPEEIANMAVFLTSEMGRSIIGDTIFMTGGVGLTTLDDFQYSEWL